MLGSLLRDDSRRQSNCSLASNSVSTSISSVSTLFEDKDAWKEFKAELMANQVKTNAGIQGMLSKFVLEQEKKKPESVSIMTIPEEEKSALDDEKSTVSRLSKSIMNMLGVEIDDDNDDGMSSGAWTLDESEYIVCRRGSMERERIDRDRDILDKNTISLVLGLDDNDSCKSSDYEDDDASSQVKSEDAVIESAEPIRLRSPADVQDIPFPKEIHLKRSSRLDSSFVSGSTPTSPKRSSVGNSTTEHSGPVNLVNMLLSLDRFGNAKIAHPVDNRMVSQTPRETLSPQVSLQPSIISDGSSENASSGTELLVNWGDGEACKDGNSSLPKSTSADDDAEVHEPLLVNWDSSTSVKKRKGRLTGSIID